MGLAIVLAIVPASPMRAHDPGLSELQIVLHADRIEASWWIAEVDLAGAEPAAFGAIEAQLDGRPAAPIDSFAYSSLEGDRRLRVVWPGRPHDELRVSAALLDQLPFGHRVFLRLLDDEDRVAPAEQMLSARNPSFRQALHAGPAAVDE